jgi:hypothetical protein
MIPVQEKLPEFWKLSEEIAADLQTERFSDMGQLVQKIKPLLEPGFVEQMEKTIPGWQKIATVNDGQTAKHTLLVCATCLNLPEYQQAGELTRSEIEWSALLHDLDKTLARRDSAHPFRSAALVALILPDLGFDPLPGFHRDDLSAWSNMVMSAQCPDGDRMLHDHSLLKEIIIGLHRCWGDNSSALRILKAVLLHQSLPTLKDWSNPELLTDEELSFALTLADMQVLGPLMIADSDSWNIFDESRYAYLEELRANNAETRRRIQKNQEY